MLMPPSRRSSVCAMLAALMVAAPALGETGSATSVEQSDFDSPMVTYATIEWPDPLNPRHVNLDNNPFLVNTKQGVLVWDVPTNKFSQPAFASSVAGAVLQHLDHGYETWARLGTSPAGTIFIGISKDGTSDTLLWWNAQTRRVAAALPLDKGLVPHFVSLSPRHALVCFWADKDKGSGRVVRLRQVGDVASLEWVPPADAEAQSALRASNVVGPVAGLRSLTESETTRPVFYDTSHCGWEMKNPPEPIKRFVAKETREMTPLIKPYFLADGRILIGEGSYFVHNVRTQSRGWENLNPPLLWQPQTASWVAIEPTMGSGGNYHHRVGQNEPVMSAQMASSIIEFLDTKAMRWVRSQQRLPGPPYDVDIEPLSTGSALVFYRESDFRYAGHVGMVVPMRADAPAGKLTLPRYRHDGEIALRDGSLMLVGDGDAWNPSTRCEIISAMDGHTRQIDYMPRSSVSPFGLELKDGSVLVFGGLSPGCGQSFYWSKAACADFPVPPSLRYYPKENRWDVVPGLVVPYTRGYPWETGNSELTSQWPRSDVSAHSNYDAVWVEGGEVFSSIEESLPQASLLKGWRQTDQNDGAKTIARLRKARTQSTLLELSDGRLAVMGGWAQLELVALEKKCFDCPDEFVSIGPFQSARTTEILSEPSIGPATWGAGPLAHYGGGRALKLANGRIFKLSLTGVFDQDGYRAEIANAQFTRWDKLPPFPLTDIHIGNLSVVGNRVLVLMQNNQTVVWDDDANAWSILKQWPEPGLDPQESAISIVGFPNSNRVIVRYRTSFRVTRLPN